MQMYGSVYLQPHPTLISKLQIDPFAFFGMQAPSIWQWGQENKVCNVIALVAVGS